MTNIAPDVVGPGIDEEYADILQAISDLRNALGHHALTNNTPDGRVLLEIAWIEQEVRRRRLPIPVDRSYARTVHYLSGSNELLQVPGIIDQTGIQDALHRLVLVLDGIGLIKPRHRSIVVAMIDELYDEARMHWDRLTPAERGTMDDIKAERDILARGGWPVPRKPQDMFPIFDTPNLSALIDNFDNKARRISLAIYEGWRPYPARKPPLPAPIAGLPPEAPPLPPKLTG